MLCARTHTQIHNLEKGFTYVHTYTLYVCTCILMYVLPSLLSWVQSICVPLQESEQSCTQLAFWKFTFKTESILAEHI